MPYGERRLIRSVSVDESAHPDGRYALSMPVGCRVTDFIGVAEHQRLTVGQTHDDQRMTGLVFTNGGGRSAPGDRPGSEPGGGAEAQGWFRKHAGVLDQHLHGRKWLLGDQMSIADFSVGVTLPYAASANMPLDEFPEVMRWHDRLSELEAWRDPFPLRRAQAVAA